MIDDPLYATADLCLELTRPQTIEQLRTHLSNIAASYGATYFLLGIRGTMPDTKEAVQLGLTNAQPGFQSFYDESNAFAIDPVIRRAITGSGAFRWEDIEHKNDRQFQLLEERRKWGMDYGFSCSSPQNGFLGLLNFAGAQRLGDAKWERVAFALTMAAHALTKAGVEILLSRSSIANGMQEELTANELLALELTAQGLTAAKVGERMNISQHTVRFHLDQSASKLGVTNRREAVTEALHLGLIRKRHFSDDPKFSELSSS
jgi:DNA-binding CsgD family transcriptional regulator